MWADNGSVFYDEELIMLLLSRLARHNTFEDITNIFDLEATQLSRGFNLAVNQLDAQHGGRLGSASFDFFVNRLPMYNAALIRKIRRQGFLVPSQARDTAMFWDGVFRHICRPGGHRRLQKLVFGRKKTHCLNTAFGYGMDG